MAVVVEACAASEELAIGGTRVVTDRFSTGRAVAPDDGVSESDFALLTCVGRVVPDDGYDPLRQRSQGARTIDPRFDNSASPRAAFARKLNINACANREDVRRIRELHVL